MKLPNKVITYKDSVLSKLSVILNVLSDKDLSLLELFDDTKQHFFDLSEFIDAIDCLFALNKLDYKEELGVLHYVG